ncbi:MAG: hypothetical protein KDA79_13590, partial [Planctomycetaceae bacterium]|nr:hypothetical protein [Planctomycetaceae bacterium]
MLSLPRRHPPGTTGQKLPPIHHRDEIWNRKETAMGNVREYGATGDGTTDDTQALQHALNDGDGTLTFPRGTYRITSPLVVDLPRS